MKIAMMLRPYPEPAWKLAAQAGVEYAVTNLAHVPADQPLTYATLARLKELFATAGLRLLVVESDPFPMDRVKLGLPGRDEDIERYCELLGMMGSLGIPVMCYNFMAVIGWSRTCTSTPTRGGAVTSSFDYEQVRNEFRDAYTAATDSEMPYDEFFDQVRNAPLTDAGVV